MTGSVQSSRISWVMAAIFGLLAILQIFTGALLNAAIYGIIAVSMIGVQLLPYGQTRKTAEIAGAVLTVVLIAIVIVTDIMAR